MVSIEIKSVFVVDHFRKMRPTNRLPLNLKHFFFESVSSDKIVMHVFFKILALTKGFKLKKSKLKKLKRNMALSILGKTDIAKKKPTFG